MVLTAVRGAIGFLSRLPVGHDEAAWDAFRTTPVSIPLVGYVIGGFLALSLLLPVPDVTVGVLFVVAVYLLTGITHIDGAADLGDAMAVHGDVEARWAAMKDTAVGAGGVLVIAIVVTGLWTAGSSLAGLPWAAVLVVIAAEVGAKTGIAIIVCVGTATHEGLGSALTSTARPRSVVGPVLVAAPAALLAWPRILVTAAAVVAAVIAALIVFLWARRFLGGVSGDVLGAANEVARVVGLHAGVIGWTHF